MLKLEIRLTEDLKVWQKIHEYGIEYEDAEI